MRFDDLTPLSNSPGLYVVQFPDRVKIGRAYNLRPRLQQHLAAGAVRVRAFETNVNLLRAEAAALRFAAERGRQVRRTESFTALSVEAAAACVRDGIAEAGVIRTRETDVPLDDLRPGAWLVRERAS